MWELDYEESWVPKIWYFWTVLLEKTLESPLDCEEVQPVHSKGDQSWVFIGSTDGKAETPILWPGHAKNWLFGKVPNDGKAWGQEEKGTTEDEMARWHHRLDGHEFEWTPGVGDGQGGLACCDSWGRKESDTTERLNWTELNWKDHTDLYYDTVLYTCFALSTHRARNPNGKNTVNTEEWQVLHLCLGPATRVIFYNLSSPLCTLKIFFLKIFFYLNRISFSESVFHIHQDMEMCLFLNFFGWYF